MCSFITPCNKILIISAKTVEKRKGNLRKEGGYGGDGKRDGCHGEGEGGGRHGRAVDVDSNSPRKGYRWNALMSMTRLEPSCHDERGFGRKKKMLLYLPIRIGEVRTVGPRGPFLTPVQGPRRFACDMSFENNISSKTHSSRTNRKANIPDVRWFGQKPRVEARWLFRR
jgi:hypothetical protein